MRGAVGRDRSEGMAETTNENMIERIARLQDYDLYRDLTWEGTFEDYLQLVRKRPEVTRNAFQRVYDMVISYGTEEYIDNKKKLIRYNFFRDEIDGGKDAIFGLDIPLMRLVHVLKAAAENYGPEKRVILLHGPVGSSKSTIARLLKKGLEAYSRTPEGALYTYDWINLKEHGLSQNDVEPCPMHDEPLRLIPLEWRAKAIEMLGLSSERFKVKVEGDLNPACRFIFRSLMEHYKGDWSKVVKNHIRVRRLIMSEKDRVGIGTFQPKDEKNQDSTELTGDINYRKIAEYGSDSDPRCVAPSTLIATGEGLAEIVSLLPEKTPADTFVPRSMAVSTIGTHRIGLAGSVYSAGQQPLRRIETRLGYRITATPNHMLLTLTAEGELAWKEMRLLQPGDHVALGRGVATWATEDAPLSPWVHEPYGNERNVPRFPERMSPSLAYLLGLWIGDGHFYINPEGHQYEFAWTQMESAPRERFAALVSELFGLQMRTTLRDGVPRGVAVGSRALVEWLQQVVDLQGGAANKAIPTSILTSTRESLLACLQGLWETDGTIRANGTSNWAMFATCSETLARQVHTALLAFGVVASLKRAPSDWEVRVYGQNVNRLVELLPSLKGRFTVGSEQHTRALPNVDVIPHIKPKLRELFRRASNREELKHRYGGNLHDARKPNVSYGLLSSFLADVQIDDAEGKRLHGELSHLLDQNHVWLPVERAEDAAPGAAYDLSVAQTHAYWANGFVSHNCFNFDGEFNISNRGIIEFVEMLKLDVAFLYDLLGASQEHKIKPKKFAQTDIDEVILGHSVAGDTPIAYRHQGVVRWTTLEDLHARFHRDATGLEVLAWPLTGKQARWTPVRSVFRHRFSGEMLTSSQKWGAVETTPNHAIYDRDGQVFYPEEGHEMMAIRELPAALADAIPSRVDVLESVPGFVDHTARMTANGGPITRPCRPGWGRLDLPRHATEVQGVYDLERDGERLKDLLTVLIWYATEGHTNDRNGGVVISQANPEELRRVGDAYARISTGKGYVHSGSKLDSAWRLYLGSKAIAALCEHHCGKLSVTKRLPDFLFTLPRPFLQHAFDELMRTDGSRKLSSLLDETASESYRRDFFEYKTISPVLAAQVGTLATLLGHDYSVYRAERPGRFAAYRVRFVSGEGKQGGRHKRFEHRLERRSTFAEWVYDIECEGLHNFVCGVGNVVCHNTNEAEYKKLLGNEFMEALRDRTIKIDIPYITKLQEEIRIYEKDFNQQKVRGKHIAPHTLEVAAMWAVLTRLEEPKKHNLTLLQKMKLYDGKVLPGYTQDTVKELRKESKREGMDGISARYVQDKISNALVNDEGEGTINPFMVLNELEKGLRHHSLITNEEQRKKYIECIGIVKREYEEIVKNEVQRAISADEEAIAKLAANYIDNIKAYTLKERLKNRYTGADDEPDERLMRSIEEKIDIPENRKDDFRREIMNYIGALAVEGKKFEWNTNDRLRRALELKLFEDQKDSIKLKTLVSSVVDRETQEKIDVIKARLIKYFGYNEVSATDVLNYVASIFARGSTKD